MIGLPYLKKRKAARAASDMSEKTIGMLGDEELSDQMIDELMQACQDKDPKAFRQAVEGLVMHSFDWSDDA